MDAGSALFRTMVRPIPWRAVLLAAACLAGATAQGAETLPPDPARPGAMLSRTSKIGMAGIYRLDGRTTASGEVYNRNGLTAAHRSLPFGTIVKVTNLRNQRAVTVRINDRGPSVGSGLIDLTPRAAAAIGLHGISVGQVRIDVVGGGFYRAESEAASAAAAAAADTKVDTTGAPDARSGETGKTAP
jgi:rare lipoprotein A